MNKLFKYILLLVAVTVLFSSCEKEITIDLNSSEPKVVIEGLVELDTLAYVKITMSKDYNADGNFPPVKGAIVYLSDDNGKEELLSQDNNGLYVSRNIKGEKNRTYSLKVTIDDQVFTSTSKMPDFVKIDSLFMYYIPAFKEAYPMVRFQDMPGQLNYYRSKLYVNGKRVKMGDDVTNNKDREGRVIDRIMYVEKNNLENDKIYKGDTIKTDLLCIDKGTYDYFDSLSRMGMSQTNPTSNITGGALGYFSAFTKSTTTVIAEWDE